jgi:hypothetical protein
VEASVPNVGELNESIREFNSLVYLIREEATQEGQAGGSALNRVGLTTPLPTVHEVNAEYRPPTPTTPPEDQDFMTPHPGMADQASRGADMTIESAMEHHQWETQERILEVEGQFADEDESIDPDVPVAVGEEITAEENLGDDEEEDGKEFQWLLELFSIKDVFSTSKNPQSNAICEQMHQTVENVLRTLIHGNPPKTMTKAKDIVDEALAIAMHAMRTRVATTLGSTPGSLAFARDMFLNVPLVADWQMIARKREHHVNENLRCANQKRRQYDYAAGEQVLKKVHNPTSLGVRTNGPYTIEQVHVNATLTIQLRQGVTERINIRVHTLEVFRGYLPLVMFFTSHSCSD